MITVVPGPGPNQFTITINGVATIITITEPVKPGCVNKLKTSALGGLPRRFRPGTRVTATIHGRRELRTVTRHHRVPLNVAGLPCGVYAIVVNDVPNTRAIRPVLRIWALTGGRGVEKAGFPLPNPPVGLS